MVWELQETKEFEKQFKKLSTGVKKRFEDQFEDLEKDPYGIGKPLGYKWFRELKNEGNRVYYLIYDQQVVVLFVGFSDKKAQQDIINAVKQNLKFFKEFVEERQKEL